MSVRLKVTRIAKVEKGLQKQIFRLPYLGQIGWLLKTNVWQILQMYMTENGRKNPPTCNVEKYFHTHFAEDVLWV